MAGLARQSRHFDKPQQILESAQLADTERYILNSI